MTASPKETMLPIAGLVVLICVGAYVRAKRTRNWSTPKFVWIMGAALVMCAPLVPVSIWSAHHGRQHPELATALLFVLIGSMVGVMTWGANNYSKRHRPPY